MDEDKFLPLSGIQHFAFCKRQWALIHIERLWSENILTIEGRHLHERVDNPFDIEKRGDLIVARSVPVVSKSLGLYGVVDVVEFHSVQKEQGEIGITLPGRAGHWFPRPVEYKRGRPKKDDRDIVQLCAQAICLEDMLAVPIEYGDIFYGEIRRRQRVLFDAAMRQRVANLALSMHELFEKGTTPPAESGPNCRLCSMVDVCMPKLTKKHQTVQGYIRKMLNDAAAGKG